MTNQSQLDQVKAAMQAVRNGAPLPIDIDDLVDHLVAEVEQLRAEVRGRRAENRVVHQNVAALQAENAALRKIAATCRRIVPHIIARDGTLDTDDIVQLARALDSVDALLVATHEPAAQSERDEGSAEP